jgi:hypothetical protein
MLCVSGGHESFALLKGLSASQNRQQSQERAFEVV